MRSASNDNLSTDHRNSDQSQEAHEMDILSRGQATDVLSDRTPLRHGKSRDVLNKKDYAIGIALLLCVVFLWTASNFITQDLFEDGFAKPFFITYMNTSAFTLYLVPFVIKKVWNRHRGTNAPSIGRPTEYQPLATDDISADGTIHKPHPNESILPKLTPKETAQLAAVFCIFWFIANWTVNAALGLTSVASATILSSMSGFFTLTIGRLFRVERLTWLKICTVLVSFFGVVLVSWSDSSKQTTGATPNPVISPTTALVAGNPLLGDTLAFVSALFYAIYVILLKVRIKEESRIDMQLFFGFVGLFNILFCWPVGLVLHLTGVEIFEFPSSNKLWAPVLINMAITLSSDYLYVLSMLKTTPLVVTVGLSLTIPFAVIGDFFKGKGSDIQVIVGAGLVLVSFIALGVEGNKEEEEGLESLPIDNSQRID